MQGLRMNDVFLRKTTVHRHGRTIERKLCWAVGIGGRTSWGPARVGAVDNIWARRAGPARGSLSRTPWAVVGCKVAQAEPGL